KDNSKYFDGVNTSLVDWLRQYAPPEEQTATLLRGFLGRMLFSGEAAKKQANVLSGGENMRAMLSRMMLSQANVIRLDEPTHHLDLASLTAVNGGLRHFERSIMFTSYDFEFINTVGNKVLEIERTGAIVRGTTDDEYLRDKGLSRS